MTHASAVDSIALADSLSNKHVIKTALLNKKYLYTGTQNNVPAGSELGEHGRHGKAEHELYITEHAASYPE